MSRSVPLRITIPKIKVEARIRQLGVNPDGTVQVPPLRQAQDAGWYKLGPSPGEIGNAVIVGHVDSRHIGAAVFYRLGSLRPGDTIALTREDRSTVRFRVDGVRSYPKAKFPTELVYGPNDQAGLRVITCGGSFDKRQQSYVDNIIVFATLVPPTTPAAKPSTPSPPKATPAAPSPAKPSPPTASPPTANPPKVSPPKATQAKPSPPKASPPKVSPSKPGPG